MTTQKKKLNERPGLKYGGLIAEVQQAVTDAALSDAEGFQFLIDNITEIMQVGFIILKDRLSKNKK